MDICKCNSIWYVVPTVLFCLGIFSALFRFRLGDNVKGRLISLCSPTVKQNLRDVGSLQHCMDVTSSNIHITSLRLQNTGSYVNKSTVKLKMVIEVRKNVQSAAITVQRTFLGAPDGPIKKIDVCKLLMCPISQGFHTIFLEIHKQHFDRKIHRLNTQNSPMGWVSACEYARRKSSLTNCFCCGLLAVKCRRARRPPNAGRQEPRSGGAQHRRNTRKIDASAMRQFMTFALAKM